MLIGLVSLALVASCLQHSQGSQLSVSLPHNLHRGSAKVRPHGTPGPAQPLLARSPALRSNPSAVLTAGVEGATQLDRDLAAAEDEADGDTDEDIIKEAEAAVTAEEQQRGNAVTKTKDEQKEEQMMMASLEKLEKQIAMDTKSKALAHMLGSMTMDLHDLEEDVHKLHKEVTGGVRLKVDDPYAELIYPISTCVKCIIMLIGQYFVVYTCLACTVVFTNLFNMDRQSPMEQALRAASDTMFYAPMLCVLFLGAQLRAQQISHCESGPQAWAERTMEVCVWAIFAQTVLVLSIPMFTGEMVTLGKRGRALEWEMPVMNNDAMARFLTLFRYLAMGTLYLGIIVVCCSVWLMDTKSLKVDPTDVWDDPSTVKTEYAPPVSPAMLCTIGLTFIFFMVYLVHAALRSCLQLSGGLSTTECEESEDVLETLFEPRSLIAEWERCFRLCTQTVDLAPMICLLFLCVRMHALHLDSKGAKAPVWLEDCFYICSGALLIQALAIIGEKVVQGKCRLSPTVIEVSETRGEGMIPDEGAGEVAIEEDIFDLPEAETCPQRTFLFVRYTALLVTCVLAGAMVASLWFPNLLWLSPGEKTHHEDEPLPPTTLCVGILSGLYFLTYLGLFTAQRMAVLARTYEWSKEACHATVRALSTLERGLQAVKFCPMLCILFFAARMRALQISYQTGSPQCWTQTAMYVTTAAVCLQVLIVLLSGFTSGGSMKVEDGQVFVPNPEVHHIFARILVEALTGLTFLALYGGTIVVAVGVLTMRPETARCTERGFYGLGDLSRHFA